MSAVKGSDLDFLRLQLNALKTAKKQNSFPKMAKQCEM